MGVNLNIIFNIYFAISFLIVAIILLSETIYNVQLNGYSIKSIFYDMFQKLVANFLNVFMCAIIIITVYILNINNIYINLIYLIVEVCVWLWAGNYFSFIFKIKYTKRVFRQLFLIVVFCVLSIVSLFGCDSFYLAIGFPLIFFLLYILYFLVCLLLIPIEKLIGRHFLKLAKKKLMENTKLTKIGITGSFGKTSTKEILKNILMLEFGTLATPESYNTPFGISKTINENLSNTHEMFVCEMGAKKQGEIKELCKLVCVDVGIVTSVGRQHLNTFGSITNVYKTKKELPDYLYKKFCVFNLMNDYVKIMYDEYLYEKIGVFLLVKRKMANKRRLKKCLYDIRANSTTKNIKLFEFKKLNNVYAKNIVLTSSSTEFDVYFGLKFVCRAKTSLLGSHNVINVLLATAMALHLGVSDLNIERGILNTKNIKARFEKFTNSNGAVIINNGYNSNLDSAPYTLKALNLFDVKNKVVVTPGLIECENDYVANFKFGKLLAKHCTEVIVVKQKNREAIVRGLKSVGFDIQKIHIVDSFDSVREVLNKVTKDYVVLIENDLPDNYK